MNIRELIDNSPVKKLQVTVIGICCMLNILDGFDVLAIAFAAPPIADEWAITPAALGLVFSAGLVGMALGAMFIAPLTDRIGRRAMILICIVAISVMMAVTGLSRSVPQLIAARALTGLGIGGMLASLTSMVAEYSPDRQRNLTIGLLQAGYPVGGTLGGLIAAWLLPEFGWRALFFGGAVMGALMIPIVALWLPESLVFLAQKQPAKALGRINRILHGLEHEPLDALPPVPATETSGGVMALLTTARRNNTLRLWLAFLLNSLTVYFIFSWVPKIVVDAGLPLEQGILAGLMVNAGAVVGIPTLGYLSGTRGLRPLILTFLLLGTGCVGLYGFVGQSVPLLLSIGFLIGFFVMGGFIGLYAVAARIYPTELRTTGIGWTIGVGRIGAIIGPYLGGIMIALQWSTATNFVFFALPLLVAGFAAYSIRARELQPGGK
jgi:MFS transporter, AAHS family, vanillate permease